MVEAVAALLPESPRGVGPTIADRAAWEAVARLAEAKSALERAEREMATPIPELSDELFLDFSRTGNRARCERVLGQRHGRVARLVLAECIANRGRFLPAIEEAVRAVCAEKTWVMPAHDRSLANFRGTVVEIDLATAHVSWMLATAHHWLGDKLTGEVRKLIRSELERRTFAPFEAAVTTGKPPMSWLTTTNNWNAVCLAGVTGSALAVIESRGRRAFFVAAAEKYVQHFLSGFTPDGYCSEGLGYWNYGFGNYVLLAETIEQATGGRRDWFADPRVRQIALFGRRMEIIPGVYPAFADCSVRARPDLRLTAFLSRRLGLGMGEVEKQGLLLAAGLGSSLAELGLYGFANSASMKPAASQSAAVQPLRDWFAEAGILICRPPPGAAQAMGVALKGGHNAEHHNHNDVGSFVVALAGETPLLDPGNEIYTARTFSSRRYESGVLNSWGHPVPRVAGTLQRTGRTAEAKVLRTDFTDQADTLVLDLRAAYDVKGLKKLQRTFVYAREGAGKLSVTDEVEFDAPQEFGTALITFSPWRRSGGSGLLVGSGAATVRVDISADGGKPILHDALIEEDCPGGRQPTRLGIDLAEPARKATITLHVSPVGSQAQPGP